MGFFNRFRKKSANDIGTLSGDIASQSARNATKVAVEGMAPRG